MPFKRFKLFTSNHITFAVISQNVFFLKHYTFEIQVKMRINGDVCRSHTDGTEYIVYDRLYERLSVVDYIFRADGNNDRPLKTGMTPITPP